MEKSNIAVYNLFANHRMQDVSSYPVRKWLKNLSSDKDMMRLLMPIFTLALFDFCSDVVNQASVTSFETRYIHIITLIFLYRAESFLSARFDLAPPVSISPLY